MEPGTFAQPAGIRLRDLRVEDLEAFIDLGLPTCAFMHGRDGVPPETLRRRFVSFVREHAFDEESQISVVESDTGEIVAQIWMRATRNRFNGLSELWIWDLTVREDMRGRGIGTALLEHAKSVAEESGAQELWLLVSSQNRRAMNLYQRLGMLPAGHLMCASLSGEARRPARGIIINHAELRELTASDILLLVKLWEAAGLSYRPRGRDHLDRLKRHLSGTSGGGWGAFVDGDLVAAALFSSDGRKGWIERVATRRDWRGGGLARAVVSAAKQSLMESGVQVIAALIEEDNTPSRRLFESCGFVHSPTLCYYSWRENPDQ